MAAFPGGVPSAAALDSVVSARPVALVNRDHHGMWVNTRCLELAGIHAGTPDPPDGRIERDEAGNPTGMLHEGAMRLVSDLLPDVTPEEMLAGFLEGQRYLHSLGITAWQDAIVGAYSGMQDNGPTYLEAARRGLLTGTVVGALWWARDRGVEQIPELVERQNGAVQAEILLSHAHWDHIQGLPHFKPFFAPGNAVRIWGSRQGTTSLEAILRQQMDPAVFPVPLDALSARLTVQQVEPGEFTVGTFRVQAMQLRHPGTTLGYRLTPAAGGPSMAYVTDNELGPGGHYGTPASWRKDFVTFLHGVELLIHDAMYTPEELEEHRGWGHSTFEEAVALAGDAGVKRLVLFHHEPEHGDEAIDALLAAARRQARTKGLPAEVLAAQEGMTLTI